MNDWITTSSYVTLMSGIVRVLSPTRNLLYCRWGKKEALVSRLILQLTLLSKECDQRSSIHKSMEQSAEMTFWAISPRSVTLCVRCGGKCAFMLLIYLIVQFLTLRGIVDGGLVRNVRRIRKPCSNSPILRSTITATATADIAVPLCCSGTKNLRYTYTHIAIDGRL